jgi:hypothetical protein
MRFNEFENIEPEVGDILGLEFGDTLIESVIDEVLEDGIVIKLDENAIRLIKEVIPMGGLGSLARKYEPDEEEPVIPGPGNRDYNKNVFQFPGSNKFAPPEPEVKPEPEVEPEREPELTPGQRPAAIGNYENAIDWVVDMIKDLPPTIVDKLSRHSASTVTEFIKLQATKSDAYIDYDFDADTLKSAQSQLADYFGNPAIKNWKDLITNNLLEAEYRGRKVPLGKPMKGDVKKSKVYVRGPKGNVVKVNFGDPNMKIKKSNPKRRKSFRARHNCDNPGPRWKARYWSCRAW